jgi:hypothetical protein
MSAASLSTSLAAPVDDVIQIVARRCGVKPTELLASNGRIADRHSTLVRARSIVAWILREHYAFSQPEIARSLNYRDHTSASAAIERVLSSPPMLEQARAIARYIANRKEVETVDTLTRRVEALEAMAHPPVDGLAKAVDIERAIGLVIALEARILALEDDLVGLRRYLIERQNDS